MKRLVKVALTLTLMVMVINVVSAQQGQRNGKGQGSRNEQGFNMIQGLDLTENQQTQMKSMRLQSQKETLVLRNKIGENNAKLRTLTTADNADMKAINKLIDANSDLRASMAKIRAANHQEVRKILTEEQRIMFDSRDFQKGDRKGQGKKVHKGHKGQKGQKGQGGQKGQRGPGNGQGAGQQGKL